ncbi:MAG TPA: PCRF domain-containing protein, partial [Roseiarcus sp.]|nr:PCRF domain-containing protein [Roseiarcus sp.]
MTPTDHLDLILRRHEEIGAKLAEGGGGEYAALARELSELDPVVAAIKAYRAKEKERGDLQALIDDPSTDAEMRAMARDELAVAEKEIE